MVHNIGMGIPSIETERLRLRGHRVEDFAACTAMWGDPVVTRYIGGRAFTAEAFSIRAIVHSDKGVAVLMRLTWPARHSSPRKSPGPKMATTASFPLLETTASLTLPFSM